MRAAMFLLAKCVWSLCVPPNALEGPRSRTFVLSLPTCAPGVKTLHVLAFTAQFALLLHYLEQVIAADNTIQQLLQSQQENQSNKVMHLRKVCRLR